MGTMLKPFRNLTHKIPVRYLTLLLSIIGVIVLYALSLFQQPIILNSVQSIDEYQGKEVTLKGKILDYQTTKYGSQLITLNCNSTHLTVYSETPLTVHIGDYLKATGTIQEYKNSWELIISNPKTVKIIEYWQNRTIQITDIARHPQDYLNLPLNITGYIDIKYNDFIYIRDQENNHTIPLLSPGSAAPETGTLIYAHATLTYDSKNIRYILSNCNKLQPIRNTTEE